MTSDSHSAPVSSTVNGTTYQQQQQNINNTVNNNVKGNSDNNSNQTNGKDSVGKPAPLVIYTETVHLTRGGGGISNDSSTANGPSRVSSNSGDNGQDSAGEQRDKWGGP